MLHPEIMAENFNSYLKRLDLITFRQFCEEHGQMVSFQAGEYFLTKGKINREWGFILDGLFTYTTFDSAGEEHIVGFAFNGTLLGDYLCAVQCRPSIVNIKAASKSKVLVCSTTELHELLAANDNELRIKLSEDLFDDAYTRFVNLYTLTPAQRYSMLISRCPKLLQHVSLKQLASYLRITPTHLSRIRKELR